MIPYLTDDSVPFPPLYEATDEGLLAIGGSLSTARLLEAYRQGIFPWYDEESPRLWWYLSPRCVLYPSEVKISKSMRSILRKQDWKVTFDTAFEEVIRRCAQSYREGQLGTWITHDMIEAYTRLHHEGIAHSVEVWSDEQLIGGLYGLVIGKIFCGESMFHLVSNASKVALIHLCRYLESNDFLLIDAQQETSHMLSMGATMMEHETFQSYLKQNQKENTVRKKWALI